MKLFNRLRYILANPKYVLQNEARPEDAIKTFRHMERIEHLRGVGAPQRPLDDRVIWAVCETVIPRLSSAALLRLLDNPTLDEIREMARAILSDDAEQDKRLREGQEIAMSFIRQAALEREKGNTKAEHPEEGA